MILHRLRVAHWRSLLEPAEVGPLGEGLNVIHAPNGTGKSSLFEALRRGLFDAHSVTGHEIEAVRPWGRALAPQVWIEFSQGGVRYRVEKTFLDGASARLWREEAGRLVPLADGRNADTRLREILAATDAPGRGLSKQEHWGLAQVLWAPQGALALGELTAGVAENLRAALGAQLSGEGGSRLEQLLEAHYLTFFTKGGKVRTGREAPPLLTLQAELATVAQERQQCVDRQRAFEEAARAVEDARQQRAQARREAEALREALTQARRQAEAYERLEAELEQKRNAEKSERERFEAVSRAIAWIVQARTEVAAATEQIRQNEVRSEALLAESRVARERLEERRRGREAARQRRSALAERETELQEARAFVADNQAHHLLAGRCSRTRELELRLTVERQTRANLVAPDDKTLREVRRHLTARDKAEATLQAALIRVTLRPRIAITVKPESAAQGETVSAGAEATYSGSPSVDLEVEGFGSIQAVGPEANVDALRAELTEVARRLARLTDPYGTLDPDALQLLRESAKEVEQKIAALVAQRGEVLDGTTAEALESQRAELAARLAARITRFPSWKEAPPVLGDLQAAVERQRHETETAMAEAEDAFEAAQNTVQSLETRRAEVETGLKHARHNLTAAQARLAELTRDGLSDAARQEGRQDALMRWESARQHAQECERQLGEIGANPAKTVTTLERQLGVWEVSEGAARDAENQAGGRLQGLAGEGVYSRLVACEERLTELGRGVQRETQRMEAARLLYDTVNACKAAAVAAVAGPVERAATRMLARVAGPRLGTVRFNERFGPAGIQPEVLSDPVELGNLSGGEQEQLFLVARLALGQVLAREERQLVVLDDVLNATDTGRLARLLALLEEAAARLQIVVLTCHPERYRALEGARFFGLGHDQR